MFIMKLELKLQFPPYVPGEDEFEELEKFIGKNEPEEEVEDPEENFQECQCQLRKLEQFNKMLNLTELIILKIFYNSLFIHSYFMIC